MEEWQPIETAPKDGTLVMLGSTNHSVLSMARYSARDWYARNGRPMGERYTHWMPLPKPPVV